MTGFSMPGSFMRNWMLPICVLRENVLFGGGAVFGFTPNEEKCVLGPSALTSSTATDSCKS
jgi:hypothetical protein